jgi:ubiquinone/menaquinone biosynthesis C-methylase UbiE
MNEVAEIHNLFGLAGAVSAASSAGLFARLTRNADTSDGHARALAVDPRATRCVLDVLVAFGLASCDGGVYEASPALLAFAEQTPLALDETSALWTHAPAFLKTGEPFHDDRQPTKREAVYSGVVAGIGRLFAAPAKDLAANLDRAPERVLDVGCGSGVWSLAIAERFPRTRVTGLDLPDVLGVFQARAIERGVRERIGTIGGDMHAIEIPQGAFDLAIIANVLRLEDPERAARLVARVANALAPGGELVVVDAIGNRSSDSQRSLSIYALHLALRTAEGRVYTREQIATWLADAGLSDIRDVQLTDALGTVGAIRARRS